ncbi:MAG: 1-acyl-sn-glycerol-3-phosphate acyltransferase [Treponema sp.]|jgi:1-acyl-sn-glycerol-3-phosphate acyltransferase|nr:1-acyl-sn-glycerol-3-phosphate acyltransferase [Treponema sp.]
MKNREKKVKHYRRHLFLMWVMRPFIVLFLRLIMGYQCKREKGPDTPSIIIANHNTDFDPAFVMLGFTNYIYFVASEHSFRMGFRSKLLTFVFAPIPINKVQTDSSTLKEIFHRLKAGFSVCIFAEGNRSYNGVTGSVPFSTAKLVKMSGVDLITYRLEGGYFTTPRWADKKRIGTITGRVRGRYSAEELRSMPPQQILNVIERDIHEDAYERQKEKPVCYRGKNPAEHIETVLYLCPNCKKTGTIHSKGNRFSCGCGLEAVYTETSFLEGAPFSTITEWDRWQAEQLAQIVNSSGDEIICADDNQRLFKVIPAKGSVFAAEGPMRISRTEFYCAGMVFPLREIKQFAIIGKMTLLFALNDGTQYEVHSAFPRSALKYLEVFRILRNE